MAEPWIVIDFETCSPVDLKKAGAYRYAEDICTEVLCLCWQFGDTGEDTAGSWKPGEAIPNVLLQAIELGVTFVAHNASFERAIWSNIMVREYGWPEIPLEQWADTMARCCQVAIPASLEGALIALGLPLQKDIVGSKYTIGLSKPNKKGMLPQRNYPRVADYCMSDVENQVGLHKWLGFLPRHERPIWELSQTMNDRGIRLDMDLVRAMQQVVDKASKPLAEEFSSLTGGLKFTQVARIRKWVEEQGVPLKDLAAETVDALLGEDDVGEGAGHDEEDAEEDQAEPPVVLSPAVHRALSIRRLIGSASIKKLKAMHHCVGADGRARGLYRYHGTAPGRQTASLFQPHNFPRGSDEAIGQDVDVKVAALMTGDSDWVEQTLGMPPVEAVVGSLRHTLIAEPGHCYMAGDYAGIQARTVLALAGQTDKTALMAAGEDVYCDMAERIYMRHITKADVEERQVGKNSVLGLGFQMGARTFFTKYGGKSQDLEFCEQVVDTYRVDWAPKVPLLWYALQDAAVDTVWKEREHEAYGIIYRLEDQWLTAEIPNGSKIYYFDPKPIRKRMPWSTEEKPDWRKAFNYKVQKGHHLVTRDAFGGLLTQNVVMKIEREIVEDAKLKLEREGFRPIMENHDEVVCEPPAGASLDTFKAIMLDVPRWVTQMKIPVAVDAWQGNRYRK